MFFSEKLEHHNYLNFDLIIKEENMVSFNTLYWLKKLDFFSLDVKLRI